MAVPTKDSLLLNWATNFNTRGTASPLSFSLTAAQMTAFGLVYDGFVAAYNAMNTPGARSKSLVAAKNTAKAILLTSARSLYALVAASSTVSDANKELIGVTVRAQPAPIPVPVISPAVDIVSVNGHTVTVRVHDASGEGKRRKPVGSTSVSICTFVGDEAPTDPSKYTWQGSTTKSIVDIPIADSVAPGSKVWITAMFQNAKLQTGPACDPISTTIQFGGMSQVN